MHSKCTVTSDRHKKKKKTAHRSLASKTMGPICFILTTLTCLLGNSYGFSLKIVPFHITFVLCCCSEAENMPNGVLITHIPALAGLASGGSSKSTQATKHFYTMFSSRNTKGLLFTCQHDYAVQCFLLNVEQWSYFPTWSCGKS